MLCSCRTTFLTTKFICFVTSVCAVRVFVTCPLQWNTEIVPTTVFVLRAQNRTSESIYHCWVQIIDNNYKSESGQKLNKIYIFIVNGTECVISISWWNFIGKQFYIRCIVLYIWEIFCIIVISDELYAVVLLFSVHFLQFISLISRDKIGKYQCIRFLFVEYNLFQWSVSSRSPFRPWFIHRPISEILQM